MNMRLSLALVPLLALAACAEPRSYVVLLPDETGAVGKVMVTAGGTTQVLDQPSQAAPLAEPKAVFTVDESRLQRDFGPALAARPPTPQTFLIYFKPDSLDLTDDSRASLPQVLAVARNWNRPVVAVVGHADRAGNEAYNDRLSLQRAEAVRDLLVQQGIAAGAIDVTSHGENNPLIPTADNVAEPRNRRVEITIR